VIKGTSFYFLHNLMHWQFNMTYMTYRIVMN